MTISSDDKTSSTSMSLTQAIAAQPLVLKHGAQPTGCVSATALELFGRHKFSRCTASSQNDSWHIEACRNMPCDGVDRHDCGSVSHCCNELGPRQSTRQVSHRYPLGQDASDLRLSTPASGSNQLVALVLESSSERNPLLRNPSFKILWAHMDHDVRRLADVEGRPQGLPIQTQDKMPAVISDPGCPGAASAASADVPG